MMTTFNDEGCPILATSIVQVVKVTRRQRSRGYTHHDSPHQPRNDIKIKTKGNEGRWSEMKVNEGR